jgi:hypothetical protein
MGQFLIKDLSACKRGRTMGKLALFSMLVMSLATVAQAAPVEQIDCVVSALTAEEWDRAAGSATGGDESGDVEDKMTGKVDEAAAACAAKHGWNDTDSENAVRYAMLLPVIRSFSADLAAPQKAIVDSYLEANSAKLVATGAAGDKEMEAAMLHFIANGIPEKDQESLELAGMYLAMSVLKMQVKDDFVAGVLRD